MTPYQQLEKIIREACPETMDLKFGCQLKIQDGSKYRYCRYFTGSNREDGELFFVDIDQVGSEDGYSYVEDFEENVDKEAILGSPLGLEHVLRAIEKSKHSGHGGPHLAVATCGTFVSQTNWDTGIAYDLTKPLSEQSEETIEYLLKILS